MKTILVEDLESRRPEIEQQVRRGETFEVLNSGKPVAMIVPRRTRRLVTWDDHLATADCFAAHIA